LLWTCPAYKANLSAAPPLVASTIGSIYGWGLLLIWTGCILHGDRTTDRPLADSDDTRPGQGPGKQASGGTMPESVRATFFDARTTDTRPENTRVHPSRSSARTSGRFAGNHA
jgi:hypothetical protein